MPPKKASASKAVHAAKAKPSTATAPRPTRTPKAKAALQAAATEKSEVTKTKTAAAKKPAPKTVATTKTAGTKRKAVADDEDEEEEDAPKAKKAKATTTAEPQGNIFDNTFTLVMLKVALRARGLKISGRKADLIVRLNDSITNAPEDKKKPTKPVAKVSVAAKKAPGMSITPTLARRFKLLTLKSSAQGSSRG